jgi:glycosyltransferase involved in cell wall biosynthesis
LPEKRYRELDFKTIATGRLPNVLVAVHAFAPGGAEGFGINLALALHRLGCAVTVADFVGLPLDPVVRARLPADIPVVVVNEHHPRKLARMLADFGIEWVSTHHPRCDLAFARAGALLPERSRPRLFCTHHGYYHLDASRLFRHRSLFARQVDLWINVAARGRLPFEVAGLAASGVSGGFAQLPAAIFLRAVPPVPRSSLSIPAEAFVVCVASRALPEKGWRTSIAAIALVRSRTGRDIRLLLAGSGPVLDELHTEGVPDFVSLLGFRADVASLYATCDLGLLASTYAGESCPLGVIECLAAGKPIIVTAIGETPAMLTAPDGGVAGALVPAAPREALVEHIASVIAAFTGDPAQYSAAASRAYACARRYDLMQVAADYLARYNGRLHTDGLPSTPNFPA